MTNDECAFYDLLLTRQLEFLHNEYKDEVEKFTTKRSEVVYSLEKRKARMIDLLIQSKLEGGPPRTHGFLSAHDLLSDEINELHKSVGEINLKIAECQGAYWLNRNNFLNQIPKTQSANKLLSLIIKYSGFDKYPNYTYD